MKLFCTLGHKAKKSMASRQYTVPKGSESLLPHIILGYYYTASIDIVPLGFYRSLNMNCKIVHILASAD